MNQLNYINQPLFGHGSVGNISEVLRDMGITKPLICTDPGLSEIGMLDQVRSLISNEFTPIVFDQTPANPTQEAVEQAFDKYKEEGCDGIIGLGGGSSFDLGKAVAIGIAGAIIGYGVGGYLTLNYGQELFALTKAQLGWEPSLLIEALWLAPTFAALATFIPAMLAVVQYPADTLRHD